MILLLLLATAVTVKKFLALCAIGVAMWFFIEWLKKSGTK